MKSSGAISNSYCGWADFDIHHGGGDQLNWNGSKGLASMGRIIHNLSESDLYDGILGPLYIKNKLIME